MASSTPSPLFRARSEAELQGLAQEALAYAAANGLLMAAPKAQQPPSGQHTLFGHAPLALLPDPFPARQYLEARDLAPLFNTLVRRGPCVLVDRIEGAVCCRSSWIGQHRRVCGPSGRPIDRLIEPIDLLNTSYTTTLQTIQSTRWTAWPRTAPGCSRCWRASCPTTTSRGGSSRSTRYGKERSRMVGGWNAVTPSHTNA